MHCLRSLLFVLLPAVAAGQTFIVDAANGPGANYTSIAAAVPAVPDGATLLVRPGNYAGFTVQGKSLTVIGGPGVFLDQDVSIWQTVEILGLSATQRVALVGLEVVTYQGSIQADGCLGEVVFERIIHQTGSGWDGTSGSIFLRNCSRAIVRQCIVRQSMSIDSHATFEDCSFTGDDGGSAWGTAWGGATGLTISGGTAVIVDCTLSGGNGELYGGWGPLPNQPGLGMTSATIRALAPSTFTAGTDQNVPSAFAIQGSGILHIDPSVTLVPSASQPIDPSITTHSQPLPSVLGASAPAGGVLSANALGPVGSTVLLVVGLPGSPTNVPGVTFPFWIDPGAHSFIAVGVPQTNAPLSASVAVPNWPGLLGVALAWQSVAVTPSGMMSSNPTLTLVH